MADLTGTGEDGIIGGLYVALETAVNDSVAAISARLVAPSLDMFWALVTLTLIIYLYQSLAKRSFDVVGLGTILFRIFIFYSLITLGVLFTDLVLPMVNDFPAQLGELLVVSGGGGADGNLPPPIASLSDQVSIIWRNAEAHMENIEGRGVKKLGRQILIGLAATFAIGATLFFVAVTFLYLIMAKILSAVLLMLFPIMVTFGFWNGSKDILQAYIRGFVWAIVLQILIYAVIGLISASFDAIFTLGPDADASATGMLVSAALMSLLGGMMVNMTPMITNMIGNVNFNVAGVTPGGRVAKNAMAGAAMAAGAAAMKTIMSGGNSNGDSGATEAGNAAKSAKDRANSVVNK